MNVPNTTEILTEKQLKEEWGIERYLNAVQIVSGWFKNHPVSKEQLSELQVLSNDAFTYFGSWVYHSSKLPLDKIP